MTSEERFTKIENFLTALAEHQVQHAEDIAQLRQMHKGIVVAVASIAEAQRAVREEQRDTEQKLRALIEKLDRFFPKN